MSYSIIFRGGSVDHHFETLDELDDSRQVYKKAVEQIKDAESIKLVDHAGETIESHVY